MLDNLIGGLAMYLAGPLPLRMLFHGFVVLVGTLMLSGAVNTAIIGSNGVLNRWPKTACCRTGSASRTASSAPPPGSSTRWSALQLFTIVVTRGDIYLLGEAYAFGVVWSFSMKALSVLVLRYKQPGNREWKVPLNFHIGKTEIPVGLALITLALFALAVINVLTKKVATISGLAFTIAFFIVFEVSEYTTGANAWAREHEQEKFTLDTRAELTADSLNVRPGNVLVAVRNPNRLEHLKRLLEKTDTRAHGHRGAFGAHGDQRRVRASTRWRRRRSFPAMKPASSRAWSALRRRRASTWN